MKSHLNSSHIQQHRERHGIDFSAVAIERAKALNIRNARFKSSDFLAVSFKGYDVIAAIECIYYLRQRIRRRFSPRSHESIEAY